MTFSSPKKDSGREVIYKPPKYRYNFITKTYYSKKTTKSHPHKKSQGVGFVPTSPIFIIAPSASAKGQLLSLHSVCSRIKVFRRTGVSLKHLQPSGSFAGHSEASNSKPTAGGVTMSAMYTVYCLRKKDFIAIHTCGLIVIRVGVGFSKLPLPLLPVLAASNFISKNWRKETMLPCSNNLHDTDWWSVMALQFSLPMTTETSASSPHCQLRYLLEQKGILWYSHTVCRSSFP